MPDPMGRPHALPVVLAMLVAVPSPGCDRSPGDDPGGGPPPAAQAIAPADPASVPVPSGDPDPGAAAAAPRDAFERRVLPLVARLRAARRTTLMTREGPAEQLPVAVDRLVDLGPRVLPYVVPELASPVADTRYFAVSIVGAVGSSRDVERLIARLGDPDPDVARAASDALGRVRDRDTIPLVFRALEDGRVAQVRWGLVLDPVRPEDVALVPFLIRRLQSDDEESRLSASVLLVRITGEDFGFDPGADADARTPAVLRWEAWWRSHERDAAAG